MGSCRVRLFQKRHFAAEIIITFVRWYLRFSLSLCDIEELMAERGLSVDHTTIAALVLQHFQLSACDAREAAFGESSLDRIFSD